MKKVVDSLFARIANKFRCWKKMLFSSFQLFFLFAQILLENRENKQISRVPANKTHQECRMGLGVSNKK
jgi:hypothetical protein